jgi:hypothetical protein
VLEVGQWEESTVTQSGQGTGGGLRDPAGQQPGTGDARVDEAVGQLADLAELPVAEHPAVFEHVHRRLTEALGELDARDRALPGDGPGRPGS